jgi:hypothetical protein
LAFDLIQAGEPRLRCLVGFYGLTRSVRATSGSIRCGFYDPLRRAGIVSLRAGHFNLPDRIENPRSGEIGIAPDRHECALLDLDLCWIEPQDDTSVAKELETARRFPDSFGDRYRSVLNLCHQLRSLSRLWSLMQIFEVRQDDLVLLLRPDLLYLDVLDCELHLKPLIEGRADLIVPGWQSWGGVNDRFAFCSAYAAAIYADRFREFTEACLSSGGMHSESFLRRVLRRRGLRIAPTDFRAVRLRAHGAIAPNDIGMIGGFETALTGFAAG